MHRKTVPIVPATVPLPEVTQLRRDESEGPPVVSATPSPVPVAHATPVIPEQLTAEQVAQLRAENDDLRNELRRVRPR